MPLCKPVKLSPDTRVDAYVFGHVTRAYGVKRYYAGYPEDLWLETRYMYVVNMPIGVAADDDRITMVFVLRAYTEDGVKVFRDCWLVRIKFVFPVKRFLFNKRALVPYKVYDGWIMKLYRRGRQEALFLASSREIAEDISWRMVKSKKEIITAHRYIYPVACYKCPPTLLNLDKPVDKKSLQARYPDED